MKALRLIGPSDSKNSSRVITGFWTTSRFERTFSTYFMPTTVESSDFVGMLRTNCKCRAPMLYMPPNDGRDKGICVTSPWQSG